MDALVGFRGAFTDAAKDFLKQLQQNLSLVLISSTTAILIKICGIVNSINQY